MGALHHAAESGSHECARILLEQGEDDDVIDALGRSPEKIARALGHTQTLLLLRAWREHKELNHAAPAKDDGGQTGQTGQTGRL
jgi:ankyrin repeat protein